MARCTKDRYGYVGTDQMALREQLSELIAAIESMARAEGAEATKVAAATVQRIAQKAGQLADEVSGKAEDAAAAVEQGRKQLAGAIQDKPLVALSLAAAVGFLVALLVRR